MAPAISRLQAGGWMQPGTSEIQVYWSKAAPVLHLRQLVVFLAASPFAARLEIHRQRLILMKIIPQSQKIPQFRQPPAQKLYRLWVYKQACATNRDEPAFLVYSTFTYT